MFFSTRELEAITKMAKAMISADGEIKAGEIIALGEELKHFAPSNAEAILDGSDRMDTVESLQILKNMTIEEKKYVCGFLAAVSIVDGNIDTKEMAMWKLVSTLASFPTMSFHEALNFWRQH